LIGTPAKWVKEIGAPSLKRPFARVFTALVTPSPLVIDRLSLHQS
jgi:hypothetical protein